MQKTAQKYYTHFLVSYIRTHTHTPVQDEATIIERPDGIKVSFLSLHLLTYLAYYILPQLTIISTVYADMRTTTRSLQS